MQSMAMKPGVRLETRHPMHSHLKNVVLPRLGIEIRHPNFELVCLNKPKAVYLYREHKSDAFLVGKFFGNRCKPCDQIENNPKESLKQEFRNLLMIRNMGLNKRPRQVVRPLSKNEKISFVLVEEFVRGHNLDYYISKAIYDGESQRLKGKLRILANFFADLHKLMRAESHINFEEISTFFRFLVKTLSVQGIIKPEMLKEFERLLNVWADNHDIWKNRSVLVHGDATPTNFIFHPEEGITGIDLERMNLSDPAYDIGLISAELKHHFAWRVFQANAAEPFIGHFFRAYCDEFEDPESTFKAITYRNRFFMALGELRIGLNKWLPWEHRKWLAQEAFRCLQPRKTAYGGGKC